MSKEDWIILRLLFSVARAADAKAFADLDVARSVLYLTRKYGERRVLDCITQLKGDQP
jgi:hypothetical protein